MASGADAGTTVCCAATAAAAAALSTSCGVCVSLCSCQDVLRPCQLLRIVSSACKHALPGHDRYGVTAVRGHAVRFTLLVYSLCATTCKGLLLASVAYGVSDSNNGEDAHRSPTDGTLAHVASYHDWWAVESAVTLFCGADEVHWRMDGTVG
jgi:hypothetical protein